MQVERVLQGTVCICILSSRAIFLIRGNIQKGGYQGEPQIRLEFMENGSANLYLKWVFIFLYYLFINLSAYLTVTQHHSCYFYVFPFWSRLITVTNQIQNVLALTEKTKTQPYMVMCISYFTINPFHWKKKENTQQAFSKLKIIDRTPCISEI